MSEFEREQAWSNSSAEALGVELFVVYAARLGQEWPVPGTWGQIDGHPVYCVRRDGDVVVGISPVSIPGFGPTYSLIHDQAGWVMERIVTDWSGGFPLEMREFEVVDNDIVVGAEAYELARAEARVRYIREDGELQGNPYSE